MLLLSAPWTGAHAHGDIHTQIEVVSESLRTDPNNAELYHKRGELHRAHREYRAALADYQRAQRLAPDLRVVHLSRGRALLETGQLEQAQRALTRFLELGPTHAEALQLRARALARLGRRARADADFGAALASIDDPSPDLFLERADNLARAGKLADAMIVLDRAVELLGPLVTLHSAALELELRLGRYDAALSRIGALLAAAPRPEEWLARKADVLALAGRLDEARAARVEALLALERLPRSKRQLKHTLALERELRTALGEQQTAQRAAAR
jgi:predicted Zn-dependent protease